MRNFFLSEGPFSDGTTSTELRFTSSTSALQNPLPASWRGKTVEITNESATAAELAAFLFSYQNANPTVTIVVGAAAADGGAAAGRGRYLRPGQTVRVRVPSARQHGELVNFNRISASGTPAISVSLVGE